MISRRICTLILIMIFFFPMLKVNSINAAEAEIENYVTANFNIEFITGTDIKINVTIIAEQLTLPEKTYNSEEIKNANDEDLGSFRLLLYQMLDRQLENTFKNAEILNFSRPTFNGNTFDEELYIRLTPKFFKLNDSINSYNFINGILDMEAYVNLSLNLNIENGWNNTYIFDFANDIDYKRTNGDINGKKVIWKVYNYDGNNPIKNAEIQLKKKNPTTKNLKTEDIFLEFEINSTEPLATSLSSVLYLREINIDKYNMLPDFVENLNYITADGIRLFIDNGFISWDQIYQKTIQTIEEKIKTTIEQSNFNQTLNFELLWDNTTTSNCSNPYNITKMNSDPAVKAILIDNNIEFQICEISSRAVYGLVNSGAVINISKKDVNFGNNLDQIGLNYNVTLYLPKGVYLDKRDIYSWNENVTNLGVFESNLAESYKKEEKDILIEIEVKNTDFNLLSFFTGKTELTFVIDFSETNNYNVTLLPEEFKLPAKINLKYFNSDALRVCIEENVFKEDNVNLFLNDEKGLFESRIKQLFPNIKVSGTVNKERFEKSVNSWDKNISSMDSKTPIEIFSSAKSNYPVNLNFGFLPPSVDIPDIKINFTGVTNHNITYRMIFPKGISINVNDLFEKTIVKTQDGRNYFEISFLSSESNITNEISCKLYPSVLYLIGIFMPCIISFVVTILLIIVIFIIHRKRKASGKRPKKEKKVINKEDQTGYEDEEFYVPPPPKSK